MDERIRKRWREIKEKKMIFYLQNRCRHSLRMTPFPGVMSSKQMGHWKMWLFVMRLLSSALRRISKFSCRILLSCSSRSRSSCQSKQNHNHRSIKSRKVTQSQEHQNQKSNTITGTSESNQHQNKKEYHNQKSITIRRASK